MHQTIRIGLIGLVLAMLAATIGILFSLSTVAPKSLGDSGYPEALPTMSLNTGVTVGPQSSVRVVSTSTARQYVHLSTENSPVFCNLSDASSTPATSGFTIAASSTFDVTPVALYTGTIRCVAAASTTLHVTGQQ